MEEKFFDAEGKEVTAVPVEKVKEIQEQVTAKDTRIAELEAEIAKGGTARTERTEELKQLREAREADSAQLKTLQEKVETKSKQEIEAAKKKSISKFAGANDELAKKLEEERAYVNIPSDTPENEEAAYTRAAKVLGLFKEETPSNPAFAGFAGREPYLKGSGEAKGDGSGFLKTEPGKQLGNYLGLPEDK